MLDSPGFVEAASLCADLIIKWKVAPPPFNFDSWVGFRQGKVAMVIEGIYMLSDLERQTDLEFAGAPLPVFGKTPRTWGGSHELCLRADLDGPSLQATWRLVRFLSDNSLDWATGGQVPARRTLRETDRFSKMPVQHAFAEQLPYLIYSPQVPFIFEYQTEFGLAMEKILRGTSEPQAALHAAAIKINEVIERRQAMMASAAERKR
jgi:multiple sugar transport system substrate-binding protein